MYKVSVIMPVYNSEKYLKYAIDSIISQSFKDWELIIVDDCSTDNSYSVAKEYSLDYENINVYKLEQNSGAWAARNYGIRKAKGEWIILIDADDVSHPLRLEIHSKFWDNPNILICHSDFYIINNQNNIKFHNVNKNEFKYKIVGRNEFLKHYFFKIGAGPEVSYRRDYALKVGLYKNHTIEDAYLVYDLINTYRNLDIVYIEEPLYYYRIHPNQKTSSKVKTDLATMSLYFIYLKENKFNYIEKSMVLYPLFKRLLLLICHLLGFKGNPLRSFRRTHESESLHKNEFL
jgi:glycosyltransferase involved in cell wall biosynthesis